jgi:uncharacterized Zn finger protein
MGTVIKCTVCNHEEEGRKWIRIGASSPDGYSSLDAKVFDDEKGWIKFNLVACPNCGTVKANV